MFTVTKGTTITLAGTIAFLLLSLLYRVVILRLITVEQWGEISITLAIATLITSLAPLGITQAVARNLSYEDEKERWGIIYYGLLITVLSGAAASAVVYLSAGSLASVFGDQNIAPIVRVFSPTIFLSMLTSTLSSIFQGFKNAVPNALFVNTLPPLLYTVLSVLFFFAGFGFTGILYGYLAGSLLVCIASFIYSRKRLATGKGGSRLHAGRDKAVALMSFGIPLLFVNAFSYMLGYSDTIILGIFRHSTEVGYYTAGLTLGRIVSFGIGAVGFIFLPVASALHSHGRSGELERTYVTATKWSLITSVPLLLLFVLFPAESLSFTFGSKYYLASTVLMISASGVFVTSILGPASTLLVAYGRTKALAMNSAIGVAGNLALSLLLIPVYGMDGGAWASVMGLVIFNVLCLIEVAIDYGIHPFRASYIRPLVISLSVPTVLILLIHSRISDLALPLLFFVFAGFVVISIAVSKSVEETDLLMIDIAENVAHRKFDRLRRIVIRLMYNSDKGHLQAN